MTLDSILAAKLEWTAANDPIMLSYALQVAALLRAPPNRVTLMTRFAMEGKISCANCDCERYGSCAHRRQSSKAGRSSKLPNLVGACNNWSGMFGG